MNSVRIEQKQQQLEYSSAKFDVSSDFAMKSWQILLFDRVMHIQGRMLQKCHILYFITAVKRR